MHPTTVFTTSPICPLKTIRCVLERLLHHASLEGTEVTIVRVRGAVGMLRRKFGELLSVAVDLGLVAS